MLLENIREKAEEKGISITKLEEKCGLSNGAIGKWASSNPRIDSLRPVAECLGVTVDELLKDKKKRK